ncbi:MAG: MFS transporter [Alphaproteobacteria bacterium]|nr:MFS transporter [Alphaproteobacteria bacterium]
MTAPAARLNRRAVGAWCLYDWGNSAFPAIVSTFVFPTYFTQAVATDAIAATAAWGTALTLAGLVVAVLSPVLGAVADRAGGQKSWLLAFTLFNVAAIAALWYVRPHADFVWLGLVGIALATIAFELATVFYNALLPTVAPPSHLGRVSGWGWGVGYVGGIACLVAVLLLFVQTETPAFGLSKEDAAHVRATSPFAALWYLVFALPLFFIVAEPHALREPVTRAVRNGIADLVRTLRTLKNRPMLAWFLGAHMVYMDGLNTLFAFGSIYAAGTFGMQLEEVLTFGIALNVCAGLGALAFAWVDDGWGPKPTIAVGLVAVILFGSALLFATSKTEFWLFGLLLGTFFGPVQSASRSLVARLARPEHRTQTFGLFALSARITTFVGPAILGWVAAAAASQRAGMATVIAFLIVGLALLWWKVPARVGAGT